MRKDEVTLRLTLDVKYCLGRTDTRELERILIDACDHLDDNGLLTGETEACVDGWEASVTGVDG